MKPTSQIGKLARETGMKLPLQVLPSAKGYYLGTATENGPYSRESEEYWPTAALAEQAMADGNFTQRVED